jgi:hypothetical protein
MESGYYPPGAEFDSTAPYNEEPQDEEEIEVTISLSISKNFKLSSKNHENDLHNLVDNQVTLPIDLADCVNSIFKYDLDLKAAGMPLYLKMVLEDCSDWNVDDFEIIRE